MNTIKLGEFKSTGEHYLMFPGQKTVWVLNHYDRITKKYSLSPVDDMNREIFRDGNKLIEVGFTY